MFMSNEADILREMEQFIGKLPPQADQPPRR